jgi:Antitoxin-like ribbon-helix-helix
MPKPSLQEVASIGGVVQPVHKAPVAARKDQKQIITWHNKAVKAALKQLAVEQDTTVQKLVADAINMLFVKHGKGPIA